MSLIPRDTSNTPTAFTPFSQDFWDTFFSSPFHFPYPLSSSTPTLPYSDLSLETSGDIRTRFECKQIPEAHLIVAELPGFGFDDVHVGSDDGGVVTISGPDGKFSWRVQLPRGSNVGMMSYSMENGVLTVVVPKMGLGFGWGWGSGSGSGSGDGGRNIRVVEITGDDND